MGREGRILCWCLSPGPPAHQVFPVKTHTHALQTQICARILSRSAFPTHPYFLFPICIIHGKNHRGVQRPREKIEAPINDHYPKTKTKWNPPFLVLPLLSGCAVFERVRAEGNIYLFASQKMTDSRAKGANFCLLRGVVRP